MMRYTPIRKKGRRGILTDRIRANVWPMVLRRARYECEGCGAQRTALDWAHVFGRPGSGFCLGPMADSIELTAALCRTCHNKHDRHVEPMLSVLLQDMAMRLLASTIGHYQLVEKVGGIRELVRLAEEDGWRFNVETCMLEQG